MSRDRQKATAAGRQIRKRRRIAGPASRGKWRRLDFFNGRQKQIIIQQNMHEKQSYELYSKIVQIRLV